MAKALLIIFIVAVFLFIAPSAFASLYFGPTCKVEAQITGTGVGMRTVKEGESQAQREYNYMEFQILNTESLEESSGNCEFANIGSIFRTTQLPAEVLEIINVGQTFQAHAGTFSSTPPASSTVVVWEEIAFLNSLGSPQLPEDFSFQSPIAPAKTRSLLLPLVIATAVLVLLFGGILYLAKRHQRKTAISRV